MRKLCALNKILSLSAVMCVASLLMGGCPAQDIGNTGTQAAAKANPPTIQFTQPAVRMDVQAGAIVGLAWTDTHPAGAVSIRLYFDHDGAAGTGDEATITVLSEAAGVSGGVYAWNTTGMATGMYRVAATINDQTNPAVTTYLAYEVVIRPKTTSTVQATLSLQQPATLLQPHPGESVMIRWAVQDATPEDRLYLYYDTDLVADNQNEQLIGVVSTGTGQVGSNDYGWTVPATMPNGTYYIMGRLSNGTGNSVSAYAPGRLVIGAITAAEAVRDLAQIGSQFPGVIFDGYQPYGHMGEVLAGGQDFNGDGFDDFMLVAPKSRSSLAPTQQDLPPPYAPNNRLAGVGEAYLVYARGSSQRWPQQLSIPINTLGTYNDLQGVRFVGPDFTGTSSGIQEVLFLDDRDGDSRPEIVFGIPDVNRVVLDLQDYDPLDSNTIHNTIPPAQAGAIAGRYYYQADGWQEFSDTLTGPWWDSLVPPLPNNPGKRSGMIIHASSQSAVTNQIVMLEEVGALTRWVRPDVAMCIGMRLYPQASSDTTQWGSQLATSDIFGNLWPALLVARPMDDAGAGSVKIMLQQVMQSVYSAWTKAPALGWNTEPRTWSFPGADSTTTADPDRMPRWPTIVWYLFMDPLPFAYPAPAHVSNPGAFDIMNSNLAVAANGHLGHPTDLKDFNGDSVADLAVSSPDATPSAGLVGAGSAYIVYGQKTLMGMDVAQIRGGAVAGFELDGTQAGEQLGWKMVGPGDLNGDGYPDWVLTAPNRSWAGRTNCGAVVIVYGRKGLNGANKVDGVVSQLGGAILYGSDTGDNLGLYMAAVGDVDRDGYPDFVVAAPGYSAPGKSKCGAVYLIYGGPHLVGEFDLRDIGTPQLPGKIYVGPEANAAIGPVSTAGDTDGDYYKDFLIGYPKANGQGFTESGRAWLIYGARREAP